MKLATSGSPCLSLVPLVMSWLLLVALFRSLTGKLVAFVVQIFYARKILLLLKSNFIAAVVVLVDFTLRYIWNGVLICHNLP